VPDKYEDQTQDLALYQYDLINKVYKLLDASPSIVDNKAYFNSNTSGTMAILITNYKRNELKSVESVFETKETTDPTIPWYTPFMRKAQSLNVINNSDQAFTQVSRAKLSDMITKLLEVEIVEDAQNPFSDISESTTYSESILTLKKLGIIKGYDDGTFKPQRSVTRAEALKIILMTAGVPESMEQSIFTDVDNEQWFTKFVMAANKLGIVKGYADGEFKPQRTITISEMTKILIKVKELKQNSLVSESTIQKIQKILSLFAR
jgi:predicted DNA-binding antitoxin AbrB/MazE fold protein